MNRAEIRAVNQLKGLLSAPEGIQATSSELIETDGLQFSALTGAEVTEMFVGSDTAEKAGNVPYPAVHVYCDKVANTLKEKFRTFSGTASLNVEIRVSDDQLASLNQRLLLYTGSVTAVLDARRGSWGDGIYYPGTYDIQYSPVKRGGRNFIQSARVHLEVHIGID